MYIQTIAEILLIFILVGIASSIIIPLVTGKSKTWWRGAIGNEVFNTKMKEKWGDHYDEKKHALLISKKDFPKEYWNSVFFRVVFLLIAVIVAFIVYKKTKGL
ncbi:MAG: hypothetical protein EXS48_03025 [Candidatus Staskawiczbacteria bacterium]|nr:hypothetical protein [Candidatus Staskawiczbacteria bacterium]